MDRITKYTFLLIVFVPITFSCQNIKESTFEPALPEKTVILENEIPVMTDFNIGEEGCTPGYWKNHPEAWPAQYSMEETMVMYFFQIPEEKEYYSFKFDLLVNALKYKGSFYKLFKYQLNEYPLYNTHYPLPQFENMILEEQSKEEAQAEVSSNIKSCANCGWILSANLTVCPKCKRSPREKFEELPDLPLISI